MTTAPTDHVLHVPTNLSPVGFRRWASHFLACRDTIVSPDPGFSPVPYFLNCRAIDLELKARQLETAKVSEVAGMYRHDLERVYLAPAATQRTLNASEPKLLRRANNGYKEKGFEYFAVEVVITGYRQLPNLEALDTLARKLVQCGPDGARPTPCQLSQLIAARRPQRPAWRALPVHCS